MTQIKYLFLDRDGVINKRLPGAYVSHPDEFEFLPHVPQAIQQFTQLFDRIVVVTNQQGIGKGLMTHDDLAIVHQYMQNELAKYNGKIDKIYYCPELAKDNPTCRKPNTGMGVQAQKDFPEIVFEQSLMVGDSCSDMLFGKRLGMQTAFVTTNPEEWDKLKKEKIEVDHIISGIELITKNYIP